MTSQKKKQRPITSPLTLKVPTKKGSQNPIFFFWANAHVEGIHN
jgi:hypothetical protein